MRAIKLALALFMLGGFADHIQAVLAAHHFAISADFFHGSADFHVILESVDDSAFGKVVRGHFDFDFVAGQETDFVHPHFAGQMAKDGVTVVKPDSECRGRKAFFHDTMHLNEALGQRLTFVGVAALLLVVSSCHNGLDCSVNKKV
jgi:hypothetical protein